jgi:hypothetical protein
MLMRAFTLRLAGRTFGVSRSAASFSSQSQWGASRGGVENETLYPTYPTSIQRAPPKTAEEEKREEREEREAQAAKMPKRKRPPRRAGTGFRSESVLSLVQRWFNDTRRSLGSLVEEVLPALRGTLVPEMHTFFRYVGRLMWLVAAQRRRPTAELTWGLYDVLIKGSSPQAVAKQLGGTDEEVAANLETLRAAVAAGGLNCKKMPHFARLECPRTVFEMLLHEYALPDLERELQALLEPERPQIRVNTSRVSVATLKQRLEGHGAKLEPGHLAPAALRSVSDARVLDMPESKEGLFEVQMEGAQLVTLMVEPLKTSRVLDIFAGAGSKTL